MTSLAATLDALGDEYARAVNEALTGDRLRTTSDEELLAVVAAASRTRRSSEAAMVEAVAHVLERSDDVPLLDRVTTRYGCRSVAELVQRATRMSRRAASDVVTAAKAVHQKTALSSGEKMPAEFPGMRSALAAGEVGVEAVVAVTSPLRASRASREALAAADEELAAAARGEGTDAAPPATVDDLRQMACVWAVYFDQDGAEPREAKAMHKRGVTLGIAKDGIVPIRGNLTQDVAAQLQLEFDSLLNPKVDGVPVSGVRFVEEVEPETSTAYPGEVGAPVDGAADLRTRAQRQHDALAIILTKATASLPTLGGAAPTLVVTVREADLISDRGSAHVAGFDEPVPLSVARHIACSGVIQRVVMNDCGRIVSISTHDRVFNHHQRKAISARDGGCIIPGCHVPASWCEIHHVDEASRGGPTHTDNGVLLCFFHHRTLDTSGWKIRVRNGVPEVKGPYWWDAKVLWRPVTKSPSRMLERMVRRT